MQPILSICIPQWGRLKWLACCLECIRRENAPSTVEVIVRDDGMRIEPPSGGETEAATRAVIDAAGVPNLRYYRRQANEPMAGIGLNIKALLNLAKGHFLWILGNDDLVKRGALGNILEQLQTGLEYYRVNYEIWLPTETPRGPIDREAVKGGRVLSRLAEIALDDRNYFTSVYSSIMPKAHWQKSFESYNQNVPRFQALCPVASFIIDNLLDRPAGVINDSLLVSYAVTWKEEAGSGNWMNILDGLRRKIEQKISATRMTENTIQLSMADWGG